ncbi:hypothetical protein B7463_g6429, partial [Scytalidium lignicola]
MATALQGFSRAARGCQCRCSKYYYQAQLIGPLRTFSLSAIRTKTATNDAVDGNPEFAARAQALGLRIARRLPRLQESDPRAKKPKQTFMNMGEPEPFEDDFPEEEEDDISTIGHQELEHHREMREYARLAAWEMPLLAKMAKPFEPPTIDTPLRFRYTTYMGEQHPAEKKVVVELCPSDMPNLTSVQMDKMKKLVGSRYNPETDIIRMSCEMFETQAQNKRYLGDLVDELLEEARDPTDTFEDVPLDTRHHVFKEKPKFPKEWRLTEERRAELEASRALAKQKDEQRLLSGGVVDGIKQIDDAMSKRVEIKLPIAEMVAAGKGKTTKGKRVADLRPSPAKWRTMRAKSTFRPRSIKTSVYNSSTAPMGGEAGRTQGARTDAGMATEHRRDQLRRPPLGITCLYGTLRSYSIMATSKTVPFEVTPIEHIPDLVHQAQAAFRSQKTKPIEYRLHQLRKLYWGIADNQEVLVEALKSDLRKSEYESFLSEIIWCQNDIIFMSKNLAKFMKDEPAPHIAFTNSLLNPRIRKEPIGTILIIGAYNFPLQLSIAPLIGAIAAGCPGVLKPSEVAPATAMVLKKIIEESLDTTAYKVVNGGVPETTALLNEKWDKIFYTGNATVGKIIAKKAAETLTPVLLELGGLNPAIITKNADPYLAARRLLWAKFHNAGQVCISQNYILVDKEILPAFLEQMKIAMNSFYPNGAKNSPDYSRIINHRHFLRIKKMLDETNGKIIFGGEMDEAENFIAPTVVLVNDMEDSLIKDESFGPLIPVLPVDNIDEAIRIANEVDSTPLGMYPFGTKAETNRLLNEITSGGASVNDGYFHGSINTLAFGGVGGSGQGNYRGKASFDAFTHRRAVTTTPGWMEKLLDIRYPPYTGKLKQYKRMGELKPDFDRNGNKVKGLGYWAGFIFSLGGKSIKDAVARWIILALIAVGGKKYTDLNGGLASYLK